MMHSEVRNGIIWNVLEWRREGVNLWCLLLLFRSTPAAHSMVQSFIVLSGMGATFVVSSVTLVILL
jgi:hypothetical protein